MRILLIEDDSLIGNGLQIGLTQLSFAVDWFTDGKTGLDALTSAPYDAVVLAQIRWLGRTSTMASEQSRCARADFNRSRHFG